MKMSNRDSAHNPYSALGLVQANIEAMSAGEAARVIKNAYKDAVLQHHPDRGGNVEEFKRATDAFDILCNPGDRSSRFFGWDARQDAKPTRQHDNEGAWYHRARTHERNTWRTASGQQYATSGSERVTHKNYRQYYQPLVSPRFNFFDVSTEQDRLDQRDPHNAYAKRQDFKNYGAYEYDKYWANHVTGQPASSPQMQRDAQELLNMVRVNPYAEGIEHSGDGTNDPLRMILRRVIHGRKVVNKIPPESLTQIALSDNAEASFPWSRFIHDMYLASRLDRGSPAEDAEAVCALARLTSPIAREGMGDNNDWRSHFAERLATFCQTHHYDLMAAMHAMDPERYIESPAIPADVATLSWKDAYDAKKANAITAETEIAKLGNLLRPDSESLDRPR